MACYYCIHFDETSKGDTSTKNPVVWLETAEGNCTISPTWQTVTGLHYCSQFRPTDASNIGLWWRRMHENGQETRAERARRIAAEKLVRELRRQLRDARARTRPA